jgi:hypothetical protein
MTKYIEVWMGYNIEERPDGWWLQTFNGFCQNCGDDLNPSQWIGPYPSFATLCEYIGHHVEDRMTWSYRKTYNKTPR